MCGWFTRSTSSTFSLPSRVKAIDTPRVCVCVCGCKDTLRCRLCHFPLMGWGRGRGGSRGIEMAMGRLNMCKRDWMWWQNQRGVTHYNTLMFSSEHNLSQLNTYMYIPFVFSVQNDETIVKLSLGETRRLTRCRSKSSLYTCRRCGMSSRAYSADTKCLKTQSTNCEHIIYRQ